MKTTYLFMERSINGETHLVTGTLEQYKAIILANAQLPMAQRRHFIIDRIPEPGEMDVMYIEVDYAAFLDWAREYIAAYRNRQYAKRFTFHSLDSPTPMDEALTMYDTMVSSLNIEREVIEKVDFNILRNRLSRWKPWAVDLLDAYMTGQKRSCTGILVKKYGVSRQTISAHKRDFEKFIKDFSKGVSI